MTDKRYNELMNTHKAKLTPEEIKEGWHFCYEWDGLIVNYNHDDDEGEHCTTMCGMTEEQYKAKKERLKLSSAEPRYSPVVEEDFL